MSNDTTLNAQKRDDKGKGAARKLRQQGRVPAVLYGRELDSVHLSVDAHEVEHLFHSISVDNTIVKLAVDGDSEPYQTLVREIQTHPWRASLLHIDFLRIQKGVAVDVDVPLRLLGVPLGVKSEGGVLEQVIHDIPVRCIPSKIPAAIEVDVSELNLNEALHVADIELEEGVEIRIAEERTICSVAIPKIIEEEVEEEELAEGELPEGEEGLEEAATASEEGGSSEAGEGDRDQD